MDAWRATEREEFVPDGRVIWQTADAKKYYCEDCGNWVPSQYEGDQEPTLACHGFMRGHTLRWLEFDPDLVARMDAKYGRGRWHMVERSPGVWVPDILWLK